MIRFKLPCLVYLSLFCCILVSIDLISFVYNHWDLENCWDNRDEIWHEYLGRVVLFLKNII